LEPTGYASAHYWPNCDGHPSLSFDVAAGVVYSIAVVGGPVAGGPVSLQIGATPLPSNDDFSQPLAVKGTGFVAEGTNAGATKELGEPAHGGDPGGHSVWFSWTAPDTGVASLSTCHSSFDARLVVYEGDAVDGLEPLSRSFHDPSCAGATYEGFGVTAGESYRFALDSATASGTLPAAVGAFLVEAHVGPGYRQNDLFGRALPLGAGAEGEVAWDNGDATREAGEPHHAGRRGGSSLWYTWTPRFSGPVSFDTCESSLDTLLAVYDGAALSSLMPVASNDDSDGTRCPRSTGSELRFDAVAGTTYRIAIDGAGGAEGSFTLRRRQTLDFRDRTPPGTRIRGVRYRHDHRIAEVRFVGRRGPARFRCKLDRHRWGACTSPQVYAGLRPGLHRLVVQAIDRAGNRDPTPATARFWIVGKVS
jgi:hypothetical protein